MSRQVLGVLKTQVTIKFLDFSVIISTIPHPMIFSVAVYSHSLYYFAHEVIIHKQSNSLFMFVRLRMTCNPLVQTWSPLFFPVPRMWCSSEIKLPWRLLLLKSIPFSCPFYYIAFKLFICVVQFILEVILRFSFFHSCHVQLWWSSNGLTIYFL